MQDGVESSFGHINTSVTITNIFDNIFTVNTDIVDSISRVNSFHSCDSLALWEV